MSNTDEAADSALWLVKFGCRSREAGDGARRLVEAHGARCWRSTDGALDYVYLPGDGPAPEVGSPCRLELLLAQVGASHRALATCHYVVETDVEQAHEEDFNTWYDQEHLPGLAAVDGTVCAARYRAEGGSPRYYACYDLVATEVLASSAWLAVRATAWSERVRPMFRNTRRTMFLKPAW